MIYYLLTVATLLLQPHALRCTSFGSTAGKDLKQPVNFSGKLTTHQNQEYMVDNISIDNKCKQIPMIDKPMTYNEPVMNIETKQMEIKLDVNPNIDFTITEKNLEDVSTIHVPSPNIIWFYQKKPQQQRAEFIEVDVTTKSNTKTAYLLDRKAHIYCDSIDPAGPQEKRVPITALNTLSIEGYSYRDTSKDNDKNKNKNKATNKDNVASENSSPTCPPCPPCPVCPTDKK